MLLAFTSDELRPFVNAEVGKRHQVMVRLYRNESSDSSSSTISDNVIKQETSTVNQARDPLCPLDPNQMFIMSGERSQV